MRLPTYIARRRARLARTRWRGSDPAVDKLRSDLAAAGSDLQKRRGETHVPDLH